MAISTNSMYQFKYGTLAQYTAATKDDATLYFLSDSKQIYLGSDLFTGVLETGKPATGIAGKLYFDAAAGSVSYWNGSEYVVIAENATSIDSKVATAVSGLKGDVTEDGDTLGKLEDRIESIEGDKLFVKALTVNGVNATVADNAADVTIAAGDIEYKAAVGTEGEEGYKAAVSVKDALDTINADASTEGSIKKAAADAVATVVDEAPEKFDTLKEIAEWIANEESAAEAANLVTRMAAAETAIGKHTVEVDGENKEVLYPVADQISDAIGALAGEETGASTDGHVTVKVTTADGEVSAVAVTTSDIASAADLEQEVADRAQAITDLVNGASAGYDTLKGLEDNIKAAAAAATTKVVNAVADQKFVNVSLKEKAEGETFDTYQVAVNDIASATDLSTEVARAKAAEEVLGGRLDTIEGEGEGSIKKALTDAKSYADGLKTTIDAYTVNEKAINGNPVLNGADIKLDGYAVGSVEAVAATDTVNAAIAKLEARLFWQSI